MKQFVSFYKPFIIYSYDTNCIMYEVTTEAFVNIHVHYHPDYKIASMPYAKIRTWSIRGNIR